MSDRRPLVLGIETSCDETAAAVVLAPTPEHGCTVLSNTIASQYELHAEYRGVVPEIASRAHAERLLPIVRSAIGEAGVSLRDIRAVAVSNRPGLIGSLLVGVAGAKALAFGLGVPIIGVDHVRAHLYAGLLRPEILPPGADAHAVAAASWPALGLVVSGGHTSLYLCQSPVLATKIGGTIDDAIGEAYDKVAAILGLPFPGGPALDRLATSAADLAREPDRDGFPIARIAPDSLDFSFSGLKTAALYAFQGVPETARTKAKREARGDTAAPARTAAEVAATFQRAAVATIILKLKRAIVQHPGCRTLLVGGGVSANSLLRKELLALAEASRLTICLPRLEYCLDNAAMIAGLGAAILQSRHGHAWVNTSVANEPATSFGDSWSMSATPTTGS